MFHEAAEITEREPVAMWRTRDGLGAVDLEGVVVDDMLARQDRAGLPLVVGGGADRAVPEALEIIRAAAPIEPSVAVTAIRM